LRGEVFHQRPRPQAACEKQPIEARSSSADRQAIGARTKAFLAGQFLAEGGYTGGASAIHRNPKDRSVLAMLALMYT
jgi:hypothetical protein